MSSKIEPQYVRADFLGYFGRKAKEGQVNLGGLEITDCDLNRGGPHRALPYAFTEQGISMLSSVNTPIVCG